MDISPWVVNTESNINPESYISLDCEKISSIGLAMAI